MDIARKTVIKTWILTLLALPWAFAISAQGNLPAGFPVTDGLSVYLDAESVEAAGDHVMGMFDLSGNNNHAWEVVAGPPSMPTLVENATPSGLGAVRFDGIGGYAEVASNPVDFDGRSRTVFLVARTDRFTSNVATGAGRLMSTAYSIIDSWEPPETQPFIRHRTTEIWLQSGGVFGVNVRNPVGDFVDVRLPADISEGEFFIGVQEWKGNGDLFAHVRNAASQTFSGDAIGGMAEPEGHIQTRFGAGSETRNTRPEEFFGGDIAAVLVYNRELSASERQDVELYLHGAYLDAGGGGGSPGEPPVLNGLVLHLNATNVLTDGDVVTELVDVSGSGNNATAYVHDPKPGYPTLQAGATPSGQDAIRFDGIGGYADVASNPEDFDGRAKTTIAVFRPEHLASADYVTTSAYEILNPALPAGEQSNLRTRVNQIRAFESNGGNLRVSARTLSGGAVNVSTPDGSIQTAGEFIIGINQVRENGDLASILRDNFNQRFEAVATGADAEPAGHIATRLAGNFASGDPDTPGEGEFFQGEIAAFLMYNRELSVSELQDVEAYLFETYLGTGPGAAGPGDPPVTNGLVLHLNGANVLTDGDVVTDLLDMSGRGNHAETFIYSAPREGGPTLVAGGAPSGKSSVRFDGDLQYLEIGSNPAHFDGWGKTTIAIFKAAVLDGRVLNTAYEEVAPGLAPNGRTRFGELHPWATNNRLRANNRTATGAFIGAHTPDGTLFANEYYLGINLARDNGDTVSILRNTANERFEGTNSSDPANPQGHLYTRIGAGSGFGNTGLEMFYQGEVAAVVIFNRELSAAELEQVEQYLYDRYLNPVATAGTYAAWISGFDVPSHLQGPEDDASGDGVSNLVKYALGLDPTVATRAGLPSIAPEVDGEFTYLTITAARNPEADDVIYIVEGSEDLADWSETLVVVDDSNPNLLNARLASPIEEEAKGFLRLKLELVE